MEIHFLFDLLPYIAGRFPAVNVLSGINNGKRFFFNTEQYMNASAGIAGFLIEEGLQKGECVLSISENCPEWNFVDMGVMLAGGIHVPVSPSLCDKELAHIIAQTEARIVFVSGKFVLRRLQNLPDSIGKISEIVSFNRIDGVQCLEDIIHLNKANQFKNLASNQKSISHPDDIATIIYTSGSTGMPKGVMLSHKNLAAGLLSTNDFFGLEPSAKIMSYLPLSHSFERWMNYVYQFSGITVCYADYGSSIISNLKEIQPDAVATVPLFLEKIYEQINASLANSEHAMNPSEQKSLIHEFLGNNLKMLFTAGAALSKKLFDYFTGMDIPVYEIYGSSETMVIAFNFRKNVRQGSVGKIKRGCRIKLSEDGEILLQGDNIMKGYFKLPEITSQAIDSEAWYHSGDIGKTDMEGFITISGRKTDIFKTTSGAFVSPVLIENLLTKSALIKFALVFGENQNTLGLIVVPDYEQIRNLMKLETLSEKEICEHEAVIRSIHEFIDEYNQQSIETEAIAHIILVSDEWSVDGGELTSSQKLKRRFLLDKYKNLILKQYN